MTRTTRNETPALRQLSSLVELERQIRAADSPATLAFSMVNDTQRLLDYRQALLWRCDQQRFQAVSGISTPDANSPFLVWLGTQCRQWQRATDAQQIKHLGSRDVADATQWQQYLAPSLTWLPLCNRRGELQAVLLLSREQPVNSAQLAMLDLLRDSYAHAWSALQPSRRKARFGSRRALWISLTGVAVISLSLLIPIRQSTLAPAEVVALNPSVLRAPINGVVARMLVEPNAQVSAGSAVARMDDRALQSELQGARQQLAIDDAQLRQAQQQALYDARSKARLAELKGRRDQARARVTYLEDQLERLLILAPQDGQVIYDDPSEWIGRPVSLGERIALVSKPSPVQLQIELPVKDAIGLQPDAPVRFFLNTDPTAPLAGHLDGLAYRARPTLDGTLAYRLKARFDDTQTPVQVGFKGTAKLYGEKTSLLLYLLRRPLTAARAWLSF